METRARLLAPRATSHLRTVRQALVAVPANAFAPCRMFVWLVLLISVIFGLVARATFVVPDATYTALWRSSCLYSRELAVRNFGTHSRQFAFLASDIRELVLLPQKLSPVTLSTLNRSPMTASLRCRGRSLPSKSPCPCRCGCGTSRQLHLRITAGIYSFDTVFFHMRREASL